MMKHSRILFTLALPLLGIHSSWSQVPQLVNLQGRVVVDGTNFDGNGLFKFALVQAGGTTTYWSNDGSSVNGSEPGTAVTLPVSNGHYSLLLGDTTHPNMTALSATVFDNAGVWLRTWFDDGNGSELLTPDRRLASVAYTFLAANVENGAITSAKLGSGAVTSDKIFANAVNNSKLAPNSVGSSEIETDAVGASEIADNAVGTGELNLTSVDDRYVEVAGDTMSNATTGTVLTVENPNLTGSGTQAILGRMTSGSHLAYAIQGIVNADPSGADSAGVRGQNNATGSAGFGVYGRHEGSGHGVIGWSNGETGSGRGVFARSDGDTGRGLYAWAKSATGVNYGVWGESESTSGRGVYGFADAGTGTTYGVYGESDSTAGRGVYGWANANTGTNYGVFGNSDSTTGRGVYGLANSSTGLNNGIRGITNSPEGYGGSFLNNGGAGGAALYVSGGDNSAPDIVLGGNDDGRIMSNPAYSSSDIWLHSNDGIVLQLDNDNDGEDHDLEVKRGDGTIIFNIDDAGYTSWKRADGTLIREIHTSGLTEFFGPTGLEFCQIQEDTEEGGGEILLRDENGANAVVIEASEVSDDGAQIALFNNAGAKTLILDAEFGSGGPSRVTTGTVQITGGSDLSEQFEINANDYIGTPEPGMIVCIDVDRPGELKPSFKSHDRTVAGIISGAGGIRPGLLMGQQDSIANGEHPVALTGRVYCMVDACNGAIEPGDLITTSDTPGHGMKVTDHDRARGAIIGKAMTRLEEGTGLVLVLVSLQ